MQLIAWNNTIPISAESAESGKNYICPECASLVRVRKGPSRQAHFYHFSASKNCRQHQKSLEHVQLQRKFFNLLGEKVCVEARFPTIARIADVAWHEKKIIFEIQCSPISLQEAKARCIDYDSVGYQVIWVLHDKLFNQSTLSAAEKYLRTTPCYFTNSNKIGVGDIYDQFDVILGHRRVFKGPLLPVNPLKIATIPTITLPDIELPQIVLQRIAEWKCYTQGDLLARLLNEGKFSVAAKKMLALETSWQKEKAAKNLPIKVLCYRAWQHLQTYILKKLSKAS